MTKDAGDCWGRKGAAVHVMWLTTHCIFGLQKETHKQTLCFTHKPLRYIYIFPEFSAQKIATNIKPCNQMCIFKNHFSLTFVWTSENTRSNQISWDLFSASSLPLWYHYSPPTGRLASSLFLLFFLCFPSPSVFTCRCMSFKTMEAGSWSFSTGYKWVLMTAVNHTNASSRSVFTHVHQSPPTPLVIISSTSSYPAPLSGCLFAVSRSSTSAGQVVASCSVNKLFKNIWLICSQQRCYHVNSSENVWRENTLEQTCVLCSCIQA